MIVDGTGLEKTVRAGIDLIGDIPYNEYTFIGIGPGYGGIEHLNNTTVSFNGNGLDGNDAMIRMLSFLAHEYFLNYNVKRIRPYELGPFDYDSENRTNLLWVSEGLTVYYEYLLVKRAGLMNEDELLKNIAGISLSREFEYVYTTKEIDYSTYLLYAGLKLTEGTDSKTGKRKFTLATQENMNPLQLAIYQSWSGN